MKAEKKPDHCRLAIILALNAPKAVIFRRGPARWCQLILWHTDTDTFEEGQWFRGKVYDRRCDLSPDGSLLIYFVAKHHPHMVNHDVGRAWTAISKPPYFTALALWPNGGTYGGGGYFENNSLIRLNRGFVDKPLAEYTIPDGFTLQNTVDEGYFCGEGMLYPWRLERGGWRMVQEKDQTHRYENNYDYESPGIWQKDNSDHRITMKEVGFRKKKYGRPEVLEFSLIHLPSDSEISIDSDSWADWDQQNRLVYVKAGRIFAGQIRENAIVGTLIADFNANKPQQIVAPEWAKQW